MPDTGDGRGRRGPRYIPEGTDAHGGGCSRIRVMAVRSPLRILRYGVRAGTLGRAVRGPVCAALRQGPGYGCMSPDTGGCPGIRGMRGHAVHGYGGKGDGRG